MTPSLIIWGHSRVDKMLRKSVISRLQGQTHNRECVFLGKGGILVPQNYTKKNGFTAAGVQRYKPDPKKYLHNIDTLWLNVDSYYYDKVMDMGLRNMLIAGRAALQDDGDDEFFVECKLANYENPLLFAVMGGNPPLYQYSLRNDSMAIYFSKNRRDNQLPMRVQLNQFLLWEKGVEAAYEEALCVLKTFGFLPSEVRINRVDFAVHSDQFQWTIHDMATFDYPRNIKDDNQPNYYRLDAVTGRFGTMMQGARERLAIRIYNKSKEIEDKQKFYFYELYARHGMDVDKIWNIEIECRRPFLKDLAEDDESLVKIFDDFDYCLANDGLSKLWSALMNKYTHDSAHWRMLHTLTDHFTFKPVHGLTVVKDKVSDFERELPQILGRLAVAVVTEEDYTLDRAIEILKSKIPEYEASREQKGKKVVSFEERVEIKKSLIQNHAINTTIQPVAVVDSDGIDYIKPTYADVMASYKTNNPRTVEEMQNSNAGLSPKEIIKRMAERIEKEKNLLSEQQ